MPQLINDDAKGEQEETGSKQTTLFCGYRFTKCFIVECAFNARRKLTGFDINYIGRNALS